MENMRRQGLSTARCSPPRASTACSASPFPRSRWPRSRCFRYNAIVVEEEGQPQTARQQLLLALAVAEFVGMLAIAVVVAKLSRQAIRPLATALALQRRFVDDASHELRARVTDTGD